MKRKGRLRGFKEKPQARKRKPLEKKTQKQKRGGGQKKKKPHSWVKKGTQ